MNPEVLEAIPELVKRGILPADKAVHLQRIARGELVSVHAELRLLLYVGVLLVMGGVGILVREHLEQIGPVTIALALGVAAAAALAWVVRTAPAFSWQEVPSPNLSFDYILFLGVSLAGAGLGYVEFQFTPLGAHWTWHLLIVSLFMGAMAFRFDSRLVLSLALSTFAAWRGVAVTFVGRESFWLLRQDETRLNAVICGALFLLLGHLLVRFDRKAHFEPVTVHVGWLLILGALFSGIWGSGAAASGYAVALLVCGASLAVYAYRGRRFSLFAAGVLGAYAGLCHPAVHFLDDAFLIAGWFVFSSVALVFGLSRMHGKMQEPL